MVDEASDSPQQPALEESVASHPESVEAIEEPAVTSPIGSESPAGSILTDDIREAESQGERET